VARLAGRGYPPLASYVRPPAVWMRFWPWALDGRGNAAAPPHVSSAHVTDSSAAPSESLEPWAHSPACRLDLRHSRGDWRAAPGLAEETGWRGRARPKT
jgi:hypothetical protein